MTTPELFDSLGSMLRPVLAAVLSAEETEAVISRLEQRYGSPARFAEADVPELTDDLRISPQIALLLRLTVALASRRVTDAFAFGKPHTPEEIKTYFCGLLLGKPQENVYMLVLDANGHAVSCEHMGSGTVNTATVLPRLYLEKALRKGGKSIILAHNHPSGDALPSSEDVALTRQIADLVSTVGIELSEHYVIAGNRVAEISAFLSRPSATVIAAEGQYASPDFSDFFEHH